MFSTTKRHPMTEDEKKAAALRGHASVLARKSNKTPYAQVMHNKFHFSIPLKNQDKPVELGREFKDAVRAQYASLYLQRIGAQNTSSNIRAVLKEIPMTDAHVAAAWKARGAVADSLVVLPHYNPSKHRRGSGVSAPSGEYNDDDSEKSVGSSRPGSGMSSSVGPSRPPSGGASSHGGKSGKPRGHRRSVPDGSRAMRGDAEGETAVKGAGAGDGQDNDAPFDFLDDSEVHLGNIRTQFSNLKQRYLYPFNAVPSASSAGVEGWDASSGATDNGRRLSLTASGLVSQAGPPKSNKELRRKSSDLMRSLAGGTSVVTPGRPSTGYVVRDRLRSEALAQLRRPLRVSPKEVSIVQADFVKWLPLELLSGIPDAVLQPCRSLLSCVPVTRLIGLMAHYSYWHILRRNTEGGAFHKEDEDRLRSSLLQTFGSIELELQFHREHYSLLRSILLLCLRAAVEAVLRAEYPLWFDYEVSALARPAIRPPSRPRTGVRNGWDPPPLPGESDEYVPVLVRLDSLVAALLDPSRLGSSIGAFETTASGVRAMRESKLLASTTASAARRLHKPVPAPHTSAAAPPPPSPSPSPSHRGLFPSATSPSLSSDPPQHSPSAAAARTLSYHLSVPNRHPPPAGAADRKRQAPPPLSSHLAASRTDLHPYPTDVRKLFHATSAVVKEIFPTLESDDARAFLSAGRPVQDRLGAGASSVAPGRKPASTLDPKYRRRLHTFSLQRFQSRYQAERTSTALERLDLLRELSVPLPLSPVPMPSPTKRSPTAAEFGADLLRPSARSSPGMASHGRRAVGLRPTTASDRLGDGDQSPRSGSQQVEAMMKHFQEDSESWLQALEHRSWRYRSPFTSGEVEGLVSHLPSSAVPATGSSGKEDPDALVRSSEQSNTALKAALKLSY